MKRQCEFVPAYLDPEDTLPMSVEVVLDDGSSHLYIPNDKTLKPKERIEERVLNLLKRVEDLRQTQGELDALYDHQILVNLRYREFIKKLWPSADNDVKNELRLLFRETVRQLKVDE